MLVSFIHSLTHAHVYTHAYIHTSPQICPLLRLRSSTRGPHVLFLPRYTPPEWINTHGNPTEEMICSMIAAAPHRTLPVSVIRDSVQNQMVKLRNSCYLGISIEVPRHMYPGVCVSSTPRFYGYGTYMYIPKLAISQSVFKSFLILVYVHIYIQSFQPPVLSHNPL